MIRRLPVIRRLLSAFLSVIHAATTGSLSTSNDHFDAAPKRSVSDFHNVICSCNPTRQPHQTPAFPITVKTSSINVILAGRQMPRMDSVFGLPF